MALKQWAVPYSLPGYAICLLHNGSTINTKLYTTTSIALHCWHFIKYIKEKNGWSDYTFNLIQWNAHESIAQE